jgi:hypothetical protein
VGQLPGQQRHNVPAAAAADQGAGHGRGRHPRPLLSGPGGARPLTHRHPDHVQAANLQQRVTDDAGAGAGPARPSGRASEVPALCTRAAREGVCFLTVLWIRISFNADPGPDPVFYFGVDPDPWQVAKQMQIHIWVRL